MPTRLLLLGLLALFLSSWKVSAGTPASPESVKINLNYDNVPPNSATNLIPWTAHKFFTNTAQHLLQTYFPANSLPDVPGAEGGLSITNIPLYPRNACTPEVHRLLQLAANIFDATRSHGTNVDGVWQPAPPSVFRPLFAKAVTADATNVWICGYEEVGASADAGQTFFSTNRWLGLGALAAGTEFADGIYSDVNLYGIPVVVGVKKGLPNFNEFAMQTWVLAARRLEIVKTDTPGQFVTNVAMMFAITNVLGMETANSYTQDYPRRLEILASCISSWVITNSAGEVVSTGAGTATNISVNFATNLARSFYLPSQKFNQTIPAGSLRGGDFITNSVLVTALPDSIYVPGAAPQLVPWPTTDTNAQSALFQPLSPQSLAADLTLVVSNTFQCLILDVDETNGSQYRVIDCVNLANLTATVDIAKLVYSSNAIYFIGGPPVGGTGPAITLRDLWDTNLFPNSLVMPRAVFYQMYVSMNPPINYQSVGWQWNGYANLQEAGTTNDINAFREFMGRGALPGGGSVPVPFPSNTVWQAPFVPAQARALDFRWQANDPLVHYTPGDLMPTNSVVPSLIPIRGARMPTVDFNIGRLNLRFESWGKASLTGMTNAFNFAIKDPGITRSDDWDFPTNEFPDIGWIGRVHRGTPWQTVYLKSAYFKDTSGSIRSTPVLDTNGDPVLDTNGVAVTDFNYLISPGDWQRWAGSSESHPANDYKLFDLFTVSQGGHSEPNSISVNHTNATAWAGAMSGVTVLSNNQFLAQPVYPSGALPPFDVLSIQPGSPQLLDMVRALNDYRATNFLGGAFTNVGDLLGVPELTTYSPYLREAAPSWLPDGDSTIVSESQIAYGLTDAAYEAIPQQLLSALTLAPPPTLSITRHPENLTALAGTNLSLTVSADGTPPFNFQWQWNNAEVSGATNGTLSVGAVARSNAGLYQVIVTGPAGSVTSSAANVLVLGTPQRFRLLELGENGALRLLFGELADSAAHTDGYQNQFIVQFTTNIVDTNGWAALTNGLGLTNGLFLIEDTGWSNSMQRFYRVIERALHPE